MLTLSILKAAFIAKGGYTITPQARMLKDIKDLIDNQKAQRELSGVTCTGHANFAVAGLSLGDFNDVLDDTIPFKCGCESYVPACSTLGYSCTCVGVNGCTCNVNNTASCNCNWDGGCSCNTDSGCICDFDSAGCGCEGDGTGCGCNTDTAGCGQDAYYPACSCDGDSICGCNSYTPCTCNSRAASGCTTKYSY